MKVNKRELKLLKTIRSGIVEPLARKECIDPDLDISEILNQLNALLSLGRLQE